MTIKKFINLALDNKIINVRNSEKLFNYCDLVHNKKSLDYDDLRLKLNKIIDCYKQEHSNPFTILANEFDYSLNHLFGCKNGSYNVGFKLAEKVEKKYEQLKKEGLL